MARRGSFLSHGMAKWGLFLALLFALWFGGWFAIAAFTNSKITEQIAALSSRGLDVSCDDQAVKGFPFRLGLHCNQVDIRSDRSQITVQSGAFRTAAQIYAPNKIVAELDGPVSFVQNALDIKANWNTLRAFVDARFDLGFELVSLNHSGLEFTVNGRPFQVETGDLHLRPSPDSTGAQKSLDIAGRAQGLSGQISNLVTLPKTDLLVDATLVDGYIDLVKRRLTLEQTLSDGAEVNIRNLIAGLGNGGVLAVSGPVSVDVDGLLSGNLAIGADKPRALAEWARSFDPQAAQMMAGLGQAITTLGQKREIGGRSIPAIQLDISRGEARIGFIRLGKIPPLQLSR